MKRKDEITDLLAEGLCVEGVKYLNSNGEVIPSKTMRSGSSAPLLVIANSLANNEKTKSIAESPKWKEIIDPFLQEENAKKYQLNAFDAYRNALFLSPAQLL